MTRGGSTLGAHADKTWRRQGADLTWTSSLSPREGMMRAAEKAHRKKAEWWRRPPAMDVAAAVVTGRHDETPTSAAFFIYSPCWYKHLLDGAAGFFHYRKN